MLSKELIKEILVEQRKKINTKEFGIARDLLNAVQIKIALPHIVVITGIRRCGKSTLLKQIIDSFYQSSNYYFINFDDERWLGFEPQNFNIIYECLYELFGEAKTFFIDEIQNIQGFENFVRRFYDDGFKFFITGSNSDLLSSELGSKLTGRYVEMSLYPFNFKEFLVRNSVSISPTSPYITEERAVISQYFEKFLLSGGMPEFVKYADSDILKQIYGNIITKDIALRFNIAHVYEMRQLYQYLITNFARRYSFGSLTKNVKIESKITVKDYISYFELSFMGKQVFKFDHSYKKQIANEKKIYVIDNGFIPLVSSALNKDKGRLLENYIFGELRKTGEVFYFSQKKECDFVVSKNQEITGLYQVTYELNNMNREREIEGLKEAMQFFNFKTGTILTYDYEEELKTDEYFIQIIPVWKWVLKI